MTDKMFIKGFQQIKTQVKFNSDFHRDKKKAKEDGKSVNMATKKEEDEEEKDVLTHGHFAPIRKKVNKIYKKIIEIKKF